MTSHFAKSGSEVLQLILMESKSCFTVTGAISRKQFGLTWNAVTEIRSVVVSDKVKFEAEIQLIKQA